MSHQLLLSLTIAFSPRDLKTLHWVYGRASCVIRNFETRTGHTVSRDELDKGVLRDQLQDSDYNLAQSVSFLTLTFTIRQQQLQEL